VIPDLNPRKAPRQRRSRTTVAAILEACACLLGRDGYADLTTNRIAERAGFSIGTLYEYFPNKEAIAAALATRAFDDLVAAMSEALERCRSMAPQDSIPHLLECGVGFMAAQRSIFSVLLREAPFVLQLPAVLRARAALDEIAQATRAQAGGLLSLPRPESDAWLISRMLYGAMIDIACTAEDPAQRTMLTRELARLTVRMAMGSDATAPESDSRSWSPVPEAAPA
jgi:AcrR family transcriptional regulator